MPSAAGGSDSIGFIREFFDLIVYFYPVSLPINPLSFVYAIVRHQVIPVSLIIRRSARYVLVCAGRFCWT